jgi:amino acid transporter
MSLIKFLLGRRLANTEAEAKRMGIGPALPAMGLDGLSSAAYGPEATLSVLIAAGAAGVAYVVPISAAIVLLLFVLYFSYRQTIAAYPQNGGSYTVASDNLGTYPGLLAATALMIDYTLNVAVGISAGVGALISAIPPLQPYILPLCLGILALITVINLRGTRESGVAFALPTYLLIVTLSLVILLGLFEVVKSGGHPHPVIPPPALPKAVSPLSLLLILKAFASGCTAMTGVEAVSNGVSAFREPVVVNARRTLAAIVFLLAFFLLGIAVLARAYGIAAMDQSAPGYQSVLSQMIMAVEGRGWFYYLTIAAILAVLCLSANTSFVDFPRLCRLLARDGFLPRAFAMPGRRLVYSVGVLFLAAAAALLLIVFDGITDRLIPLFAIGAFLAFTLSQAGMAVHWWKRARQREGGMAYLRLFINGGGAIATLIALGVILIAKFLEGAWITVAVIPLTLTLLRAIKRYYARLDAAILGTRDRRLQFRSYAPPVALLPLQRWDRLARKALNFAMRVSHDVYALHLVALEGPDALREESREAHIARLRRDWARYVAEPARRRGLKPPELVIEDSPYRSLIAPLLRTVFDLGKRFPGRPVMVVMPEVVEGRWWEMFLHTRRAQYLRRALLRHGGTNIVVATVPWQTAEPEPEEILAEEEPELPPAETAAPASPAAKVE